MICCGAGLSSVQGSAMASRSKYTFERAPSLALMDRIVQALILAEADGRGPLSSSDLSPEVFSCVRNVTRIMAYMTSLPPPTRRVRTAPRRRHTRGEPSALYSVGSSRHAPRPAPYTSSELCKRYREANPEVALGAVLAKRAKR